MYLALLLILSPLAAPPPHRGRLTALYMWCPGGIVVRSRGELLGQLKTQPRHSAQRVVKKVLRMLAVVLDETKLWFMAVLAVDEIAFCSRDWLTRPIAFCSREVLRPRHHRRSPVKRCCW